MFELKYKITDADVKAEDKRNALESFAVYVSIGLVGLAVGIVAVVLHQSTALFVLGIIMTALAALLCVIAVVLIVPHAPIVKSVVIPSEDERTVRLDGRGIAVYDSDGELVTEYGYPRFIGMKVRADYIRLTVEKNRILIVKWDSPEQKDRIREFLMNKLGKKTNAVASDSAAQSHSEPDAARESGNASVSDTGAVDAERAETGEDTDGEK